MMKFYAAGLTAIALIALAARPSGIPAHAVERNLPDGAITFVSLNMAKEPDCDRVVQDLKRAPRLAQADVLMLQEVSDAEGVPSVAEKLAKRIGYFVAFSPEASGVHDRGLAVVSRYPIAGAKMQHLKEFNLRYHSRNRFALALDLQTPNGSIHVWNVHLDTRLNAEQRLEQLRPVMEDAAGRGGARLIGGDFNTNDFYWFGNLIPVPRGKGHGAAIREQMEERGFRTPFVSGMVTFPQFRRQLDWIYVKGLEAVSSSVEPVPFSDHHALWTVMRQTNAGN